MSKYIDFVIEYKNGKKEITVINGEGVKCNDVPTEDVVKKLMGDNVEITDFAKTDQYYDEIYDKSSNVSNEISDPFIQRRNWDDKEKRVVDL